MINNLNSTGETSAVLNFVFSLITVLRELVDEQTQPLKDELTLLQSLQDEWVDTKEAMRLTGIKQAETLKAERERPGTLLIYKFEGKAQKSPRYLRSSLVAYSERKIKRRVKAQSLVARPS